MNWSDIWERKGKEDSDDLEKLNGFTTSNSLIDKEKIFLDICNRTKIKKTDKILEFGCGAGRLSEFFIKNNYLYTGIEKSSTLIEKYKKYISKQNIFMSNDLSIPFAENTYEIIFCWSVLQYLDNEEELIKLLNEMLRVSKNYIFIGDIETVDRTKNNKNYNYKSSEKIKHLTIDKDFFKEFFRGKNIYFYNENNSFDSRYNIVIKI